MTFSYFFICCLLNRFVLNKVQRYDFNDETLSSEKIFQILHTKIIDFHRSQQVLISSGALYDENTLDCNWWCRDA